MLTTAGLLSIVLLIVSVALVKRALRGLRLVGEILRRRRTPIADARDGLVEVAGQLVVARSAHRTLDGVAAAAIRTTASFLKPQGKNHTQIGEQVRIAGGTCRLRDASGDCLLELADAEIVGEVWASEVLDLGALSSVDVPWKADAVPFEATHVRITQEVVPEGATVMVTGFARPVGNEGVSDDLRGYRDAPLHTRLTGALDRRLLVVVGGQRTLVARYLAALILSMVAAIWLGVYGAIVIVTAVLL